MIYKMEKLSGALSFITNLTLLSDIYPAITEHIARIIRYNKIIYPDVVKAIPPITIEIEELYHEYSLLSQKLDEIKIKQNKQNLTTDSTTKNIYTEEQIFKINIQQLNKYNNIIKNLEDRRRELIILIRNRENTIERLNKYKKLIEEYAI